MGKIIEITDEQYAIIAHAAEARGQTADALLSQLIEDLRDPLAQPRYFETEEWFRHLEGGDFEEEADESESGADADAR